MNVAKRLLCDIAVECLIASKQVSVRTRPV